MAMLRVTTVGDGWKETKSGTARVTVLVVSVAVGRLFRFDLFQFPP